MHHKIGMKPWSFQVKDSPIVAFLTKNARLDYFLVMER